jgi:hypothetical protein
MLPAIVRNENTLKDLRDRLKKNQATHVLRNSILEDEHRLDQAAVESFSQQLKLHRAALTRNDDDRLRLMVQARDWGQRVLTLTNGASGRAARILRARAAINTLFANYTIDQIEDDGELSSSRDFASRYGTWSMFMAAFDCAAATRDPRLAHYFAEMAILLPHRPYVFSRATNVTIQRPAPHCVETSARLLYMSKKLDDQEATKERDWHPRWLEGRIRQLDETHALLRQAERVSTTNTTTGEEHNVAACSL